MGVVVKCVGRAVASVDAVHLRKQVACWLHCSGAVGNDHQPLRPTTPTVSDIPSMPIKHLESKLVVVMLRRFGFAFRFAHAVFFRAFSDYLFERKHLQTLSLAVLSDSRLGIDASYYLQQITDNPPSREPLLAATGGLPLALTQRIESDLRALEKLRIKPVFVFQGLLPNKRWKQHHHGEHVEACRDRRDAWTKYEQGQEEAATKLFEGRSSFAQWDLWRMVLRIFRHRNVEFLIAPYVAWAQVCTPFLLTLDFVFLTRTLHLLFNSWRVQQLIYLQRHHKAYIHAIYGPTDALLYPGVDKLITALELSSSNPTFQYTSKRNFVQELGVTEDQFLDIGILVGFDHSPPFPPTVHEQALKATVDMVKYYKSGHAAVAAFADHPAVKTIQYSDHYARTRSMIRYSLILSSEGSVLPLPLAITTPAGHGHHPHHPTAADVPQDLHEIFTHRLPDEIYYYLSRGLLGPQALVWLTSGQIVENPPLDNGETTEYKRFVKEVITDGQTGPRATALALVSSVSHSFWANKKVQGLFWFEQPNAQHQKAVQHNSPQTAQLAERVAGWNVPYSIVEEELRRQNIPSQLTCPLAPRRAMHNAIKPTRVNDKFQDPLYLFLELVRAGVMHGHLWSGRAFSGGPSFGTDEEKSSMLLVMRVLSIVPLNFKSQPWSAPLSRELLVFNSFVRSLTRALRTLIEVTSLNMLLRNDARRARDDLLDIALSLPFQTEVNTGFGVLAKVYLDALTHINGGARVRDKNAPDVKIKKEMALDLCEETFPGVKSPTAEVERGFRFWDAALAAMRHLHSEGAVLRELIDQFEAADAWLAPMRP
ncbi:hypothetical protein NLJ89_g3869 [Agrocybe chaxingu]|uniref:XPG-I domain-containing protein n=1 Tax=Agrocybe chaxingu TaxID=84603 RepID=A0A9W8K3S8_9AGAR|nr:hypothetical protein NLJ89_g3869 [Agrocybe chaxingu]